MDKSKRSQFCIKFPLEVKGFLPKGKGRSALLWWIQTPFKLLLSAPQQELWGPKDLSLSYRPFSFNSQAGGKHLLKWTQEKKKKEKRKLKEIRGETGRKQTGRNSRGKKRKKKNRKEDAGILYTSQLGNSGKGIRNSPFMPWFSVDCSNMELHAFWKKSFHYG